MQEVVIKNNKIRTLVRQQVMHSLREILTDPDFSLELRPAVAKRLKKSSESYHRGLFKPLDQVLAKFQLK